MNSDGKLPKICSSRWCVSIVFFQRASASFGRGEGLGQPGADRVAAFGVNALRTPPGTAHCG
jgi:hypothetical protein